MIGLIQLVNHANVMQNNMQIGAINRGILALIGIEKADNETSAEKLIDRILDYRIFTDDAGKMNLNLKSIDGGLLLVPQFTLVAETNKGTRPGFSKGMSPQEGSVLFAYLANYAKKIYSNVETGKFGVNMQVTLCNDGPVTFILTS
ncbi:MAG TPA: D-aminoacyl-tRNA deacylase [Gammaproteobacteria bacterium]|nr:D-aminoacyl-tRNA deacylase [Gammaproteobacteria bacterium]